MPRRRANTDSHVPATNEWLFSCPTGLTTRQISEALGAADEPCTEVSAQEWRYDWQMANTFIAVYGYPKLYQFEPEQPVNWDGFSDWMLIKKWKRGPDPRKPDIHARFVGELVIIRHSHDAAESVLAFLLDVVQSTVTQSLKLHSCAGILVVLEDWDRPVVEGRVRRRVAWTVNRLPSA